MATNVTTIPIDASLQDALGVVEASGHSAYPVVDATGDLRGIISRSDLLSPEALTATDIKTLARSDVVTIGLDSSRHRCQPSHDRRGVDYLPVVDATGRMLGICTRTDILKAAGAVFASDQPEAGWLTRRRRLDEPRG